MSTPQDDYKRHVERIKAKISCHDLAEHLAFKRQGSINAGKATYFAPWGSKANTTLSLSEDVWYDHAEAQGGSVVDLYMRAKNVDFKEAVKAIGEIYGMPLPKAEADPNAPRREEPLHVMIAQRCLVEPEKCLDYLTGRKIGEDVVRRAIKKKTLGFNDFRNPKYKEGEPNHGGPAVAIIITTPNPGHVAAVEMRYIDPELNGGVKNKCLGDKAGHVWCSNWRYLLSDKCHTVYITEGFINALSIETAALPGCAAIATMGVGNIEKTDWRFLRGKRVLICLDHNDPIVQKPESALNGYRTGLFHAWRLHEILTGCDISAMLVDQDKWAEGRDVNDLLQSEGEGKLKTMLMNVEEWLVPGMSADIDVHGRRRVFLPGHHWYKYSKFRVTMDSTRWITGYKKLKNDDDTETDVPTYDDVATFRVAAMSRVSIQSATATMTGDTDSAPKTLFAISVQAARHKNRLVRAVFEDKHLHKMDRWEQFGSVLNQSGFRRMIAVLETTTDIGARDAVNLVGLGWRAGKLSVNEGHECYFSDPDTQCPYVNLVFPRGTPADGREVLNAWRATFKGNAGTMLLTWALGGHIKVILGFWPHLTLQGNKGSGKSTIVKALERTIGMVMNSGQSMQTDYRIVKSVSYTTHPIGWEEISARSTTLIDKAVSVLQEAYNYTYTTRGFANTDFLLCAPVLLAGEDVPVRSLIGKLVSVQLSGRKADMLPDELPKFPVRQWLEFLATQDKVTVRETYRRLQAHCLKSSRATGADDGANRMADNYAAVLTAWSLLCDFLDVPVSTGDFGRDIMAEMNTHIKETSGDREPWVWIVEMVMSEIAAREFKFPFEWAGIEAITDKKNCLLIRTSHMIDHIARTPALKAKWDGLPIKSDRVLKQQLTHAKALLLDAAGQPRVFERTLGGGGLGGHPGRRVSHLVALDLDRLAEFGIHAIGDADILPSDHSSEVLP